MKKAIKIINICLLILILNIILLSTTVHAVDNEQIYLYPVKNLKRVLKFKDIVIKTVYVVYQKDGQEYPAYCINADRKGVENEGYEVTDKGKITDLGLWRVVTNGYPYKTPEQLGVEDQDEAFIATKQAIYCYIYNRGTEEYTAIGQAGQRILNAINSILENANNSQEEFENSDIQINYSQEWNIDGNFLSKTYVINSNKNISRYSVQLETEMENMIITDLNNNPKNNFNSNENFKILIPISNIKDSGTFKINIKTEMNTKPVIYGEAPSDDVQNYVLTGYIYEDKDKQIIEEYPANSTKIKIIKEDITENRLEGAQFDIFNEKNELIKTIETDKNGECYIEQLQPGKYYIKEKKAPEGYELEEKEILVEIQFNQEKQVKFINKKIEVEIPKNEEVIIEKTLPITGR